MSDSTFYDNNDPIGELGTVGEFWRWAMSDLLSNANRGVLAEYIVGKAIGADVSEPRLEWDCYDLKYGNYSIEVKSSALIQSWHKPDDKHSTPTFGVAPHTCWEARTNTYHQGKKRWADAYVFCLLTTREVLDLDAWQFYVVSTQELEEQIPYETKTLSLKRVKDICGAAVGYKQLRNKVDQSIHR